MTSLAPTGSFRRARRPPPGAVGRRGAARRFWPQYVAVSPFYVLFAVFGLFPVLFSLYLTFQRWDGLNPVTFAGLDQYRFLVQDKTFRLAVFNTLVIWVMSTVPMLFFSLILASLLNSVRRWRTFYEIVLFIPSVTSIVAIALFFKVIFSNEFGVLNAALQLFGLPKVGWLNGFWSIKIVLATLMTWQWVGYNALIYYAGMQAIPGDVYEAARLDGAGPIRIFWSVTIPLLRPVIIFTVVISTITGLQTFTEPQVVFGTNAAMNPNSGGPGNAGMTMVLYFYQQAFTNNNFGYGATIAYGVFVIVALFSFINWRIVARRER